MNDMEILCVQKATVYDLLLQLEKEPNKTYTIKELKNIFTEYIKSQS